MTIAYKVETDYFPVQYFPAYGASGVILVVLGRLFEVKLIVP